MKRFHLRIALLDSNPAIIRRVIVDSELLLPQLHDIIQTVMPWEDDHLHQFEKDKTLYEPKDSCEESIFEFGFMINTANYPKRVEYSSTKISDLLSRVRSKMTYQYDFGDSWIHEIVVEKIEESPEGSPRAEYVGGQCAAPPEDCGGLCGYENFISVVNDPSDRDYDGMREWAGLEPTGEYDPSEIGFDESKMKIQVLEMKF